MDEEDFDEMERQRKEKIRKRREMPSEFALDDDGNIIDLGVDPDEFFDVDPRFLDDGVRTEDETDGEQFAWYGDGPIDLDAVRDDPFEADEDDPFGLNVEDPVLGIVVDEAEMEMRIQEMLDAAIDDRSHGDEYLSAAALQVSRELDEEELPRNLTVIRDRISRVRQQMMRDMGERDFNREVPDVSAVAAYLAVNEARNRGKPPFMSPYPMTMNRSTINHFWRAPGKKRKNRASSNRPTNMLMKALPAPMNMANRTFNHGPRAERRGEYLNPRHKNERIRNINGMVFQMLPDGGSGVMYNGPYGTKSEMRQRAERLRKKGYNARVIPMKGNKYGKYAIFLSKKVRYSQAEQARIDKANAMKKQLRKPLKKSMNRRS